MITLTRARGAGCLDLFSNSSFPSHSRASAKGGTRGNGGVVIYNLRLANFS
jgi:hypothetical protein